MAYICVILQHRFVTFPRPQASVSQGLTVQSLCCREYNIALRTEIKRREIKDDPKRAAELAAYFTHAKLESYHTALALRSAMLIFAKLKNYNSCATFCRRMLELNSTQKVCSCFATSG